MKKETSNKLYSFLYLFVLYLGIQLLPLKDWISIDWLSELIKMILLMLIVALQIYEIKRGNFKLERNRNLSYLFLIPLIAGCFSNFLYCWFFNQSFAISIDMPVFIVKSFSTLVSVIIEELLFRYIVLAFFIDTIKDGKLKNILCIAYSSLLFGSMHVINFYGNNPLTVLSQIGYTIVLGLILGFIALFFESPIVPIIGHFLFNYLNTNLVVALYQYETDVIYYVFSISVAILIILYLVLIYYLSFRRKENAEHQF